MGADFEAYYAIRNFWKADFSKPSDHPVMRGVKPFSLYDECYFHLRECGRDRGKVDRLWPVHPPAGTIEPGLSPHRGNDHARTAVNERKEEQYVAWAFARPKGGRAAASPRPRCQGRSRAVAGVHQQAAAGVTTRKKSRTPRGVRLFEKGKIRRG